MNTIPDNHPEAPPKIDALVIGGGIAGLWILDRLRAAGRTAVLAEASELGNGQSVCAQGIVHGGLKYALGGVAGEDARHVSTMPELWKNAIVSPNSAESPDLNTATILSPCTWLWRSDSIMSRIGMVGARLGLQTKPEAIERAERPDLLREAPGAVLRVNEPVVEMRSVLHALCENNSPHIIKVNGPEGIQISSLGSRIRQATLHSNESALTIAPEFVILAAGVGNEGIRTRLGLEQLKTQRRPLHMVMVKGLLPEFFGHCVDGNKTRVTITSSAVTADGHRYWQIGGEISEQGVSQESHELISTARKELAAVLPSLNQSNLEWATYRVDRAEEETSGSSRPDDFSYILDGEGRTITCWPTKMALAPRLAREILTLVPALHSENDALISSLAKCSVPSVASYPWSPENTNTWIASSDVPA